MRRITLSLAVALAVSALALPVTARVDGGCSNGQGFHAFEVGVDADAAAFAAEYPTVALAIADGVYTLADLEGQLEGRDKNDNGWLCVKDVYDWSTGKSGGSNAQSQGFLYFVNAVDDNPAP